MTDHLPNMRAERAKKFPKGTAKKLAWEAAKETGKLVANYVLKGGIPSPMQLLSLSWQAINTYRSKRQEALQELETIRLKGREKWALSITTVVQASTYNVTNDARTRQEIDDFIGADITELVKAEENALKDLIQELQAFETVSLETLKRVEALPANATPGMVEQEARLLTSTLQASETRLEQLSDALPAEETPDLAHLTDDEKRKQRVTGTEVRADGEASHWLYGVQFRTESINYQHNYYEVIRGVAELIYTARLQELQPWVPNEFYRQMTDMPGSIGEYNYLPGGTLQLGGISCTYGPIAGHSSHFTTPSYFAFTLPEGKTIKFWPQLSNTNLCTVEMDGQNMNTKTGVEAVLPLMKQVQKQLAAHLVTEAQAHPRWRLEQGLVQKTLHDRRQKGQYGDRFTGIERTSGETVYWSHGKAVPASHLLANGNVLHSLSEGLTLLAHKRPQHLLVPTTEALGERGIVHPDGVSWAQETRRIMPAMTVRTADGELRVAETLLSPGAQMRLDSIQCTCSLAPDREIAIGVRDGTFIDGSRISITHGGLEPRDSVELRNWLKEDEPRIQRLVLALVEDAYVQAA
jgi:hypothetical protein